MPLNQLFDESLLQFIDLLGFVELDSEQSASDMLRAELFNLDDFDRMAPQLEKLRCDLVCFRRDHIGVEYGLEACLRAMYPWVAPSNSSPIMKLPAELLSMAFEISLHPSGETMEDIDNVLDALLLASRLRKRAATSELGLVPGLSEVEGIFPSVLLSHVCRRWRLVALDTASLWSTVTADIPSAVPVFLERSRRHPLNVELDFGLVRPDQEDKLSNDCTHDEVASMMSLLVPHAPRWQIFSFSALRWSHMQCAIDALARVTHAPFLECLSLDHETDLSFEAMVAREEL